MSAQAFEWKLTPTERRIAEAAYADSEGGAWRAVQKIMHLRGERGPWDDGLSLAMNNALLDELRREPETNEDKQRLDGYSAMCAEQEALATRYRVLLERMVRGFMQPNGVHVPEATRDALAALEDARNELVR